VVFVGLATGISASVSTSRRAMGLAMSLYIFFVVLWNAFANQVASVLKDTVGVGTATQFKTIMFLKLLNPTVAYKTLLNSALLSARPDIQNHAFQARVRMFGGNTGMEILARRQTAAKAINETVPIWASDLFVVVYMLVWLFVPVAIGYFVFRNADL
jgi:ABC-2 type transport system permease protein